MTRLAVLSLLVVASLGPGVVPPRSATVDSVEPFTLGVLRRDGMVLPFTAFDGSNWTVPWPEDLKQIEVPISLGDVPKRWWGKAGSAPEWSVWSNGVPRGSVRIDRVQAFRLMCATRIGLRTDYKPSETAPPPFEQPYPKDGLVVSGPQKVEPLPSLPKTPKEWADLTEKLPKFFDDAELRALRRFTNWSPPFGHTTRLRTPIEIEAVYRAPMDKPGWTAYYLEAVKNYPLLPVDKGCGLVTSASGWLRVDPKGTPHFDVEADVTYCDRKNVGYMLPLGLVKTGNRTHWVYQISGYEREYYVVTHPDPKAIEIEAEYQAGFCRPTLR